MLTDPLPGFPVPVNGHFGAPRGVIAGIDYGTHKGLDKSAPAGTPVPAAGAGIVTHSAGAFTPCGHVGGGNHVIVDHGGGLESRYFHLLARYVVRGQAVTTATIIGSVGATGTATGNHLHFEVVVNGQHVDPARYIGLAGAAGRVPLVDRQTDGRPVKIPRSPPGTFPPHDGATDGSCPPGYTNRQLFDIGNLFADHCYLEGSTGTEDEGESVGQLFELALPPLLEPALNLAILATAALLVYAGVRRALA